MQVDPLKPTLKPPGAKRLKLKCDMLLSTAAFKFSLRRYTGGITIRLEQVPKMLGHVRKAWCTDAFTVGFKLETDPEILAFKSVSSLRKYGMHVVVGNEMAGPHDPKP